MPDTNEPTLIPKGALKNEPPTRGPEPNDPVSIVDDSSPKAGRILVQQNRELKAKMEEVRKRAAVVHEENNRMKGQLKRTEQLETELEAARKTIESLGAEGAMDRRARKFQAFCSILTGLAANGQMFGTGVDAKRLENAVAHALGVAEIAENKALLRGI